MKRIFLNTATNIRFSPNLKYHYCLCSAQRKYILLNTEICDFFIYSKIFRYLLGKKHIYSMATVEEENKNILEPPECVRGMKILDRSAFEKTIKVPYVIVENDLINHILQIFKSFLLKLVHLKPVQEADDKKLILLNPVLLRTYTDLTDAQRSDLLKYGLSENDLLWKDIKLTYDNWKADIILKAILPLNLGGVTSFSIIGHILHLNLKEQLNDYKKVIGQVLLDKTPNITTVVNKVDIIETTYRTFNAEILAGEENLIVSVKENGVKYEFNFAEVYWNPRLCTEHLRIISKLNPGDVLYDVFAGVGPFAIPAAKKKCLVIANDLNPEANKWLGFNAKLNKVESYLKMYNMDGRQFITDIIKADLLLQWSENDSKQIHIVMNLPALALEFLPSFSRLYSNSESEGKNIFQMPWIHCYCFVRKKYEIDKAIRMVESKLECSLGTNKEVIHVRSVAPNKEMWRITFQIPREVLFGNVTAPKDVPPINILDPPECVRGMKILDRSAFDKIVKVPYVIVEANMLNRVREVFKSFLLRHVNMNPVQNVEGKKLVLLSPLILRAYPELTDDQRNELAKSGLSENDLIWKEIKLTYDSWKADVILKAVLPLNQSGITNFSIIRHILHLSLKEHLNDYKKVIGQVLLDKIQNITTVVNKVDTSERIYKPFNAEILAGKENLNLSVRENGVRYEFNFAEVYWNPRLGAEHLKIVSKLNPGDVLYDVFAGVGPFAIPAAKKKCLVIANDLNPEAHKWLIFNAKANKVDSCLKTYNMDGRQFIKDIIKTDLLLQWSKKDSKQIHITMNLPALGLEFLPTFIGLCSNIEDERKDFLQMPWIHYYCFLSKKCDTENALKMVESKLECSLNTNKEIAHVINIGHKRHILRITFQIPREVLFSSVSESQDEPPVKKAKLMEDS